MKFHRLMILLFSYDNVYILLSIMIFSLPQFSEKYRASCLKYIAPKVLPLIQISLTGSVYSTMAISLERYLIFCSPFYAVSHKLSTKIYIPVIVIFSIIYNIPKFLELKVCDAEALTARIRTTNDALKKLDKSILVDDGMQNTSFSNCTNEGYIATDLRLDTDYYSIYLFWMNLIVMGVIPFLIIIILNSLILNSLRLHLKDRRKRSVLGRNASTEQLAIECCIPIKAFPVTKRNQILLAKTNLVIVFTFMLCHSLRWIPNIYEFMYQQMYDPTSWVQSVEHVSHLLITLSSSANSYIYYFTHFNLLTRIRRSISRKRKLRRTSLNAGSQVLKDMPIELPMLNVAN